MARRGWLSSLWLVVLLAGCGAGNSGSKPRPDLTFVFPENDGGEDAAPNECGNFDPTCTSVGLGPPFPLGTDPNPDPGVKDDGVLRDQNGWLTLDSTHSTFDYLWIANSNDWNTGTVTKLNSKTIKEVARYLSATCYSLKTGGTQTCDGTNGCCAMDDYPRFKARKAGQMQPVHETVNLQMNYPSRTAVDFNGDVWVANRAFGMQSSVTKIANDRADCIDRNRNGKLDTSSDVSGDGLIQTDCNQDMQPDDIATVKALPCKNGMAQEFYGLDDECILFTTNTNTPNQIGRPLALGPGAVDTGPSDAWAGTYQDAKFFRIDGVTGLTKDEAALPGGMFGNGCNPYGLAVDSTGIGWAPNLGQGMCYFDTAHPTSAAIVRLPANGQHSAYGITLDRDQNVWTGGWDQGDAFRYSPTRGQGFMALGQGYWTTFTQPGQQAGAFGSGRGIAADARSPNAYFIWMARDDGWIVRVDASKTPKPQGMDITVPANMMPGIRVAGTQTIGVGVDRAQNVWGVSYDGSVATRILVDQMGNATLPDLVSPPKPNMMCPAGDTCPLDDRNQQQWQEPNPYTYSDFTGFGLRNFTKTRGAYSYLVHGCMGAGTETQWMNIVWDGDVPVNTSITVHARSGNTSIPDNTWGDWTMSATTSPIDLGALVPNKKDSNFLQVEFLFNTNDQKAVPRLKSFEVRYQCTAGVG